MINKLYYFAHQYTAKDAQGKNLLDKERENFELSCVRSAELIKLGYNIYSPISHSHPIHVTSEKWLQTGEYKIWVNLNNLMIERTKFDGIILSPEWETSSGCKAEKKLFESKGLEILLYHDLIEWGKTNDGKRIKRRWIRRICQRRTR